MDNHREELRSLIEKENVVSKVNRLIDLKVQYYSSSADYPIPNDKSEGDSASTGYILSLLEILKTELNSGNALVILELLLDDNFANHTSEQIRQAILTPDL